MSQPQPVPYYQPSYPHSHDKYIVAIILAALIFLVIGGVAGYALGVTVTSNPSPSPVPVQSVQLIWLHGSVNTSPNGGTGLYIFFDNQDTGTLSSAIFSNNSYQLWIQVGKTYTVKLYSYSTISGTESCSARPGIFTPTTTTTTQDFLC